MVVGKDRVRLVARDNGYPSRANFTGIAITPGLHWVVEWVWLN